LTAWERRNEPFGVLREHHIAPNVGVAEISNVAKFMMYTIQALLSQAIERNRHCVVFRVSNVSFQFREQTRRSIRDHFRKSDTVDTRHTDFSVK